MTSNLQDQPNLVHVGDDDWLFLVGGSNSVLDLYQEQSSFTQAMSNDWVSLLEQRSETFAEQGIEYFHLPAPEKLSVMHSFYRDDIPNINGSPIMQLASRNAPGLECLVNVIPHFSRQVGEVPLYWKTDTHWSFWGCFSAYQLLCSRLGVETKNELMQYPFNEGDVLFDLGAKLPEQVREKGRFYNLVKNAERSYANTIVRFKEKHNLVNDGNLHVGSHVIYKNKHASAVDKCVVLFGDSFSEYRPQLLTGMLAETFREVHFIWNGSVDHEYVRMVSPDIVITELAERFMTRVPQDNLSIVSFASERLTQYKQRVFEGDPSMGFAAAESVIVESVVLPQESYPLAQPFTVQEDCVNINNDPEMKTHPVRISQVDNAKVYFNGGRCLVRAPGGEIVTRYRVSDEDCVELPWKDYRKVEGTVMLFGSSMGAHCYYHWMLDLLPKMGIMEKAGIPISSIDYFLVREMNGSFHKETLERLGIDSSRIIETKNDSYLDCEKLIDVSLNNGINLKMHSFIPTWMNELYPTALPVEEPIKLYISRPAGVRRGVSNEDELIPILEKAGYTISAMEGISVEEQAALLSRADVVISPHGGALTNIVFCKPGIQVVELFGRHVYPFYYGLAQLCGHDYHAILEAAEDYPRLIQFREAQKVGSVEFQQHTREASFAVNLDHFRATLRAVEINLAEKQKLEALAS